MSSNAAVDLTSANYLGLWLGRNVLPDWGNLATGLPAVLDAGDRSDRVAAALSALIGRSLAATMATSTLHASWDIFAALARKADAICVDAAAYPIARWAAEHAALRGAPRGLRLRRFAHHNPAALRQLVEQTRGRGTIVVLTDSVCPGCGVVAPIPDYLAAVTGRSGVVVVDDTQGLGVLGTPAAGHPYGVGGGGVLRHFGLPATAGAGSVVLVASMAKAFGVPVAVIASSAGFIRTVRTTGQTRVHCSPPSNAHLVAAEVSLRLNADRGESTEIRARRAGQATAGRLDRTRYPADEWAVPGAGHSSGSERRCPSAAVAQAAPRRGERCAAGRTMRSPAGHCVGRHRHPHRRQHRPRAVSSRRLRRARSPRSAHHSEESAQ